MTVFDVANRGIRVAVCDQGFEFIQQLDTAAHGESPVPGLCVKVDDLDEARARMERAGRSLKFIAETPGGAKEMSFGSFHGFQLVLDQYGDEGWVKACVGDL